MALYKALRVRVTGYKGKRVIWYLCEDINTGAKIKVKKTAYTPPMRVGEEVNVCGEYIIKGSERRLIPAPKSVCEKHINSAMVEAFRDYQDTILKHPEKLDDPDYEWLEDEFIKLGKALGKEDEASATLAFAKKKRRS